MKKLFLTLLLLFPATANADLIQMSLYRVTTPDTKEQFIIDHCDESLVIQDVASGDTLGIADCAGTPHYYQIIPYAQDQIIDLQDDLAAKQPLFTGSSSLYVKGDGTLGVAPSATWGSITGTLSSQTDLNTALNGKAANTVTVNGHGLSSNVTIIKSDIGLGNVDNTADSTKTFAASQITSGTKTNVFISDFSSAARALISVTGNGNYNSTTGVVTINSPAIRIFNYPSRALNSCFQISSTNDADFHYNIKITANLTLTGGDVGTVTATSYTNSGCTTGAQTLNAKQNGNTGTLTIGIATAQLTTVGIDGTLPGGKWLKMTTAQTTGTPTFVISTTDQAETILP